MEKKLKFIGVIIVIGVIIFGAFNTLNATRFMCDITPPFNGGSNRCFGGGCSGDYAEYIIYSTYCRIWCYSGNTVNVGRCIIENIPQ